MSPRLQSPINKVSGATSFLDEDVAGLSVLLVDDQVVTGWTMTRAAHALRDAGAAAVLPLALATQS